MKINILFYLFISLFIYNGVVMADSKDQNLVTMVITQNEKVTDPNETAPQQEVILELFPDIAPQHVKQIKTLISEKFEVLKMEDRCVLFQLLHQKAGKIKTLEREEIKLNGIELLFSTKDWLE